MRNFSISKLAEIILAQRKELNLTQQELADKAGINRSMLCHEAAVQNLNWQPKMDLAEGLARTINYFKEC